MMKNWERWLFPAGWVLLAWIFFSGPRLANFHSKWLVLESIALVSLIPFCFSRPVYPALRRSETIAFLLILSGSLAHLFWFHTSGFALPLAERLGFLILLFSAWRAFSRGLKWEDLWWPVGIALIVSSLYGLWQVAAVGFSGPMPYYSIGSFFGHTNNSAQFIGLSLLLWWTIARPKHRWASFLLYGGTCIGLSYFLLTRGRSALLALVFGALIVAFLRFRARRLLVAGVAAVALLVVGYIGLNLSRGKTFEEMSQLAVYSTKGPLLSYRADVWAQTLKMIADQPLGVGLDRFGFEFVPYHRLGHSISPYTLAISPHNEFLRYPAEEGIPLFLAYLAAIGWVIFRWWKAGAAHREIFLPAFGFFFVESVVQFPWQNANPVFFSAMMFGSMAATVWRPQPLASRPWIRAVCAVGVLFFVFLLGASAISRVGETSKDPFWANLACEASPSNWHACINHSQLLIESKNFSRARELLERMLEDHPWNYAAIRHLGVAAHRERDLLGACFHLWRYHDIFLGRSDLEGIYMKQCPEKWRNYFERKRPKHYYPRGVRPTVSVPGLNLPPLKER